MEEFDIQAHTRQCFATGRVLEPGEKVHSVLVWDQGKLVRRDYADSGWTGFPEGVYAYWSGRVPELESPRRVRRDDELLFDCLDRLESDADPKQLNFRYVVALLLVRGKKLQLEGTRGEGPFEYLRLLNPKTGNHYEVLNRQLSETEIEALHNEVASVVGWN